MKAGFYPKLALDGIRKNKRVYLPYILTCIGMVMMDYIIWFLQYSEPLNHLPGGSIIPGILDFGGWIIAIFSCIFLFYTNSFLIRRRKKEFGLYHILGMGKRNIGKILFWESLMIALISLGVGLAAGITLSKLAELGLVRMMRGDVGYDLSVSMEAVVTTLAVFAAIFLLLFLNAIRQVRFSNAVTLLRSENAGEKPPKGNWFWGILGVLILGGAYYLAVTIEDPVAALATFFIAVIMVIVGSYLVMISGSVLFCRILQKKKSYYYKPNHFVSVSSMVYRMKRNGAGLASICILATMVLVMLSSTASLYFGGEDALHTRYPREINISINPDGIEGLSDETIDRLYRDILAVAQKHHVTPENAYQYRRIYIAGQLSGTAVETDVTKIDGFGMAGVYQFYFLPLSDYNAMTGAGETLADGEALLYINRGEYREDTISFNQGNSFRIKKRLDRFFADGQIAMSITSSMVLVVPDLTQAIAGLDTLAAFNGDPMVSPQWSFHFDTGSDEQTQLNLWGDLLDTLSDDVHKEEAGYHQYYCDSRALEWDDFYGLFGGLFYLGILLSIVFILAAVLIIYYKQISEGYEDQARFEIMQKVGMTKREIRRSINSQLLTVFFLPLIFAACHLAFAFPMIQKLLLLFNLTNVALFAVTTVISVVIFALFYALVYRITSNAYYNIVSGAKEK